MYYVSLNEQNGYNEYIMQRGFIRLICTIYQHSESSEELIWHEGVLETSWSSIHLKAKGCSDVHTGQLQE